MFARLGRWCHDRRRLVLGLWLAVLVLGGVISGAVGGAFRDEFNLPDVESKQGFDILESDFGSQGTGTVGTIVFRAEQGVDVSLGSGRTRAVSAPAPETVSPERRYPCGPSSRTSTHHRRAAAS